MRLTLHLLGPPEVHLDGEPVSGFVSDKARALLFYLAVEAERAHRRETLCGLLWPDYPERSARTNLSNALSNLRAVIGDREAAPPYLSVSRETIQFNDGSDHWLDVAEYGALVDGQQWADAVALYRGGFLEGFSLPDSAPFEGWALVVRERFQREMMAALEGVVAECEEDRDYARAQEAARRQLEIEPWHEGAHRALMRALALSGERNAALNQYERCRRVLQEELGVEPSPETVRLVEQIRDGRLAAPVARGAQPPDAKRQHNLPAQLTPFVGREEELARIRGCLEDPNCRLLTMVGPGGSGKTRLALEAAWRLLDSYRDGAFFVSLAPLRSVDSIVPTVAQALGFAFYSGQDPRQQLLGYLREKRMLLVLDNYEHLLSGATLVTDILKAASGVKVVTTSRTRLNVQGEQLLPVNGMDVPTAQAIQEDDLTPESLAAYSALRLFAQGARQVQPGFELTADSLRGAIRICQLVEGMPLAILLAAGWMHLLSPAEIADEMAQSIDFLASSQQDIPERQRSMRAVFDHSWNLLTAREREVMQALSVFSGGFTREAARQVTGASLRDLASLVDRSLLHRTSSGRYEVHELLRQYAAEKLERSPDGGEAVRDRHCAHYAAALETWGTELESPRELAVLAEMDVEIDNARAAWTWAVGRERVDWLLQAYNGMYRFYGKRERPQEWKTACQQAEAKLAVEEHPSADRQRMLAKLLVWQSSETEEWTRETRVSELKEVLSLLDSPALADQDTRAERASVLRAMSWFVADLEQAVRLLEQSLALSREVGDQPGMWGSFVGLRMMARHQGDLDKARQWATECLATSRAMGAPIRIAGALTGLGNIAREQGQLEEAERLHREALALRRKTGSWALVVDGLWQLGGTNICLGRFDQAHSLLSESLAMSRDRGSDFNVPEDSESLARAAMHLGRYDRARTQLRVALDHFRRNGQRHKAALALLLSIELALVEEAYEEANRLAQQVSAIYQETGMQEGRGTLAALSAYIAYASGKGEEMQHHLCTMLEQVSQGGEFQSLMLALPMAALFLVVQGQRERAVELYALASRYPYVANSCWFADVVGKQVSAAAADLSPAVVTAARERGRARDLEATAQKLLVELGGLDSSSR